MWLFKNKKHKQFSLINDKKSLQKTLHKNLDFTAIEQYKLIRANLDFTLPDNEKCPVIGVTSAMHGDAKSTTAINLSYVFAESGHKVLLIDGDMRMPSVASKLEIESQPGLSDFLKEKDAQISGVQSYLLDNWYTQSYLSENWHVLPAGEITPNPSELLASNRMARLLNILREKFDYIIIDLPPVNVVSDAIAISGLITGMIVVIRENYTEKNELERCFRQLNFSNVKILGCVMTGSKSGRGSYGKYKNNKYYKYSHYSRSEPKEQKK